MRSWRWFSNMSSRLVGMYVKIAGRDCVASAIPTQRNNVAMTMNHERKTSSPEIVPVTALSIEEREDSQSGVKDAASEEPVAADLFVTFREHLHEAETAAAQTDSKPAAISTNPEKLDEPSLITDPLSGTNQAEASVAPLEGASSLVETSQAVGDNEPRSSAGVEESVAPPALSSAGVDLTDEISLASFEMEPSLDLTVGGDSEAANGDTVKDVPSELKSPVVQLEGFTFVLDEVSPSTAPLQPPIETETAVDSVPAALSPVVQIEGFTFEVETTTAPTSIEGASDDIFAAQPEVLTSEKRQGLAGSANSTEVPTSAVDYSAVNILDQEFSAPYVAPAVQLEGFTFQVDSASSPVIKRDEEEQAPRASFSHKHVNFSDAASEVVVAPTEPQLIESAIDLAETSTENECAPSSAEMFETFSEHVHSVEEKEESSKTVEAGEREDAEKGVDETAEKHVNFSATPEVVESLESEVSVEQELQTAQLSEGAAEAVSQESASDLFEKFAEHLHVAEDLAVQLQKDADCANESEAVLPSVDKGGEVDNTDKDPAIQLEGFTSTAVDVPEQVVSSETPPSKDVPQIEVVPPVEIAAEVVSVMSESAGQQAAVQSPVVQIEGFTFEVETTTTPISAEGASDDIFAAQPDVLTSEKRQGLAGATNSIKVPSSAVDYSSVNILDQEFSAPYVAPPVQLEGSTIQVDSAPSVAAETPESLVATENSLEASNETELSSPPLDKDAEPVSTRSQSNNSSPAVQIEGLAFKVGAPVDESTQKPELPPSVSIDTRASPQLTPRSLSGEGTALVTEAPSPVTHLIKSDSKLLSRFAASTVEGMIRKGSVMQATAGPIVFPVVTESATSVETPVVEEKEQSRVTFLSSVAVLHEEPVHFPQQEQSQSAVEEDKDQAAPALSDSQPSSLDLFAKFSDGQQSSSSKGPSSLVASFTQNVVSDIIRRGSISRPTSAMESARATATAVIAPPPASIDETSLDQFEKHVAFKTTVSVVETEAVRDGANATVASLCDDPAVEKKSESESTLDLFAKFSSHVPSDRAAVSQFAQGIVGNMIRKGSVLEVNRLTEGGKRHVNFGAEVTVEAPLEAIVVAESDKATPSSRESSQAMFANFASHVPVESTETTAPLSAVDYSSANILDQEFSAPYVAPPLAAVTAAATAITTETPVPDSPIAVVIAVTAEEVRPPAHNKERHVNFGASNEVREEVFVLPTMNATHAGPHVNSTTEALFDHFSHHTHETDAAAVSSPTKAVNASDSSTVRSYSASIVGDMIRKGSVMLQQRQLPPVVPGLQTSPRLSDIRPSSAKVESVSEERKSPRVALKEVSPRKSPRVSPRLSPRVLPPIKTTNSSETTTNTLLNAAVTNPAADSTALPRSSVDKAVKFAAPRGEEGEKEESDPRPVSANTREINGHSQQNNNNINNYLELISGKGPQLDMSALLQAESEPVSPQPESEPEPQPESQPERESVEVQSKPIESDVGDASEPVVMLSATITPFGGATTASTKPVEKKNDEEEEEDEPLPIMRMMHPQNGDGPSLQKFKGARDSMLLHQFTSNVEGSVAPAADGGTPLLPVGVNADFTESVQESVQEKGEEKAMEPAHPHSAAEHRHVGFRETILEFSPAATPLAPAVVTTSHVLDAPSKAVEHLTHEAKEAIVEETDPISDVLKEEREGEKASHVKSTIEFFEGLSSSHSHAQEQKEAPCEPVAVASIDSVAVSSSQQQSEEDQYASEPFIPDEEPETAELDVVITRSTEVAGQYDLAITSRPSSP
eukprot:gene25972-32486_t